MTTKGCKVKLQYASDYLSISKFKDVDLPPFTVLKLNELVYQGQRSATRTSDRLTVFRDSRHLNRSFVKTRANEVLSRLHGLQAGPNFMNEAGTLASDK